MAVRQHAVLGQRSTSPLFSEPFWIFRQCVGLCRFMRRVVYSEAVIHEVFGCLFSNSAFPADGVCALYFVQPVLELLVVATSQTIHRRLLFPLQCCFFSAVKLLSFHAIHQANSFMRNFSPSDSTPDGGLRRVVVVSNILIGCSSFSGFFVCHLIPHYPAVAWAPGEGYLLPFIMEGNKES